MCVFPSHLALLLSAAVVPLPPHHPFAYPAFSSSNQCGPADGESSLLSSNLRVKRCQPDSGSLLTSFPPFPLVSCFGRGLAASPSPFFLVLTVFLPPIHLSIPSHLSFLSLLSRSFSHHPPTFHPLYFTLYSHPPFIPSTESSHILSRKRPFLLLNLPPN